MLDDNVPQPWRARSTLVLALTVVAVSLGNIQRLPYLMGEHGGGTFMLVYVLSLCVLSAPVLTAEVVVGALGRGAASGALHWASSVANMDSRWRLVGVAQALLALLTGVVVALLSLWLIDETQLLYSQTLASGSAADFANQFLDRLADTPAQFRNALLLMTGVAVVSAAGGRWGMGFLGWVILPVVIVALFGALDFVLVYTDLRPVEEFLFARDLSKWSLESTWLAIESAGFTLGIGLGVGMALGAQAPSGLPWARTVLAVAVLDTTIMMVTAIVVTAVQFEVNLVPAQGMTALFVGLPYAFANMPLGEVYGGLFFATLALVSCAAVVILLEPAVQLLSEEWGLSRLGGSILGCTAAVLLIAALLFGLDDPLGSVSRLIAGYLIPLSVLFTALFVGWRMPRPVLRGELFREPLWLFRLWWVLLRWVVPPICVLWLARAAI